MPQEPIKIVITGASGRMGRALLQAISTHSDLELSGALERIGSEFIGKDVGFLAANNYSGVCITSDVDRVFSVANSIVDFSTPETSVQFAQLAAQHGVVHVIGTTGFTEAQEAEIAKAAEKTVIIKSGNFSIGVNVLAAVTERVAQTLSSSYDIEIFEMHHKHKVDAPSGTALLLGNAAAKGRKVNLKDKAVYERFGHTGARKEGDIGFATLRGGSVVGDHTVMFAGAQERIELTHKAESRMIFADGAIASAIWGHVNRLTLKTGLYSMRDVLGL